MQNSPRESGLLWMGAGAFLAGLLLRVLFLGSKSLWLDEAISLRYASDPSALFSTGFDNVHPPLYYILLHYWLPLGLSESTLRLSSALVGSLAVPLSYMLAADLGGRALARTTVWLVALSPLLVWFSQELRSYSLLVTLALAVGVACVRLLARPNFWWWLAFIVAMSATLYTHYNAPLLLIPQVVIIAVFDLQQRLQRTGVLLWLAAWPVVALAYMPWLTSPGMEAFAGVIFMPTFYPVELLNWYFSVPHTTALAILFLAAALSLLGVLAVGFWLVRRGAPFWERVASLRWVRYGVLALFLLATVISVVPRLYSVKKLVIELWPYGLLVVGWIFPWKQTNRILLAILLAASLVGSVLNVTIVPKDRWRELVAQLSAQAVPGDAIWVVPGYHAVPFSYYLGDSRALYEIPGVTGGMSDAELAALAGENRRIWLIYHTVNFRLADPERRVQQWLDNHFVMAGHFELYRMDVMIYEPRP